MDIAAILRTNLQRVQAEIADACSRAGRAPESVRLVAVTKYVDAAVTAELVRAGAEDLGENRPQVLEEKAKALEHLHPRWHLIGHLQRNKVRKVFPHVHLLHSGDSLRLLETVNEVAAESGKSIDVLLEVNISAESAKHGFQPEELIAAVPKIFGLTSLRIRGLMGMSGLEAIGQEKQNQFASLRILLERVREEFPEARDWRELSMGMTDDFPAAIAEGSTLLRIGSALFAGLR
ncbi:MAG: YggS family pyridoxal phosphate-dependent enzyme [Planctomycetota bacterium]